MSNNSNHFIDNFLSEIVNKHLHFKQISTDDFNGVIINDKIVVNLIGFKHNITPQKCLELQSNFQTKQKILIHLWEDVWWNSKFQVLSRLESFCQQNQTLFARKLKVATIDTEAAKKFLNQYHLQGFIKTKYHLGLFNDNLLVAVASFSSARKMTKKVDDYNSAELVRFATISGITVVGGLSKLIKSFIKMVPVNDIMTYADRDWSLGKGYDKLGFTKTAVTAPTYFYVDPLTNARYLAHRLPKSIKLAYLQQNHLNLDDYLIANNFLKVFNTGNLKYHYYIDKKA